MVEVGRQDSKISFEYLTSFPKMKFLANKLSDNAVNTVFIVHPTKDSNTF